MEPTAEKDCPFFFSPPHTVSGPASCSHTIAQLSLEENTDKDYELYVTVSKVSNR